MRMERTSVRGGGEQACGDGRDARVFEQSCAGAGVVALEDLEFFLFRRVGYADLQEEAIELRFGQGVGAFEVDWVLGGEDGEPRGQRACGRRRW